jgi:A/G-specific adenine glycosylase
MKPITTQRIQSFRAKLLRFYRTQGRDLPWRRTTDPYCICVSELMLQQTQVERVLPKYQAWLANWPDWAALSRATNRELLAAWSGLGYNRRALYLGKLAQAIMTKYKGAMPDEAEQLRALPGIGPYTANAILIFAFNRPTITIDTNIRKVLLYEFGLPAGTPKRELEALAQRALPRGRARDWHNALMDYARIRLPRRIPSIPALSRQSRFEGSLRQIRGEIVRQLTSRKSVTVSRIAKALGRSEEDVRRATEALQRDGVVVLSGKSIRLNLEQ